MSMKEELASSLEGLKYLLTIWILKNSLGARLPAIKMLGSRNSPRTFPKALYFF